MAARRGPVALRRSELAAAVEFEHGAVGGSAQEVDADQVGDELGSGLGQTPG